MDIKTLTKTLKNASPETENIEIKLIENNVTKKIEITAMELTEDGVVLHGQTVMTSYETMPEWEQTLGWTIRDIIKKDPKVAKAIFEHCVEPFLSDTLSTLRNFQI